MLGEPLSQSGFGMGPGGAGQVHCGASQPVRPVDANGQAQAKDVSARHKGGTLAPSARSECYSMSTIILIMF